MNYLKLPNMFFIALLAGMALSNCHANPGAGCESAGISSGTYTLQQGEIVRSYRVQVPGAYAPGVASPMVMVFHGWGGNENEFLDDPVVRQLADERGYILVAPRGLGSGPGDDSFNSWSFSGSTTGLDGDGVNAAVPGDTDAVCDAAITPNYSYASCQDISVNSCSWTQCQANDVNFVLQLVQEIESTLCVDSENIFASGGSNGGMFTWELGQNPASAPVFRAIAPIIGLPHRGYLASQGKTGDMPVLLITGTADNTVPPGAWQDASFTTTSNGSDRYFYTGATAITMSWASAHACDVSVAPLAFQTGSEQVDCRTYCQQDSPWPRVLDCRADMGHRYGFNWSWPMIMDFFDAHSNPATNQQENKIRH